MRPVGIQIGRTFTAPLMAVRDRYNRVVVQQQAVTDLAQVREALSELTR